MSRYEPVVKALVVDETEEEDYSMSINLYTQYIHVYSTGRTLSLEFKLHYFTNDEICYVLIPLITGIFQIFQ